MATVGTQIAIHGANLKRKTAPAVFIKKAGSSTKIALALVGVVANQITARVKVGVKAGDYQLWIKYGTTIKIQAPGLLTISPPANLSSTPEVGTLGSKVTINAGYLGMAQGTVLVDAKVAAISSWLGTTTSTSGSVAFKVPAGLTNGYHELVVSNSVGSASIDDGLIVAGQADTSGVELRLSNAAATSNTEILVQFTKAVDPRKAELATHYRITANDGSAATVRILSAEAERPDLTTVKLTTLPQSEISYKLKVTDIVDLAGKPIAAPSGTLPSDPSLTTFAGIGPGTAGQGDNDVCPDPENPALTIPCPDGITDADELRGYSIAIRDTDGTTETRWVTSDPDELDTDGEGLDDGQEKLSGSDPRSPDTDGDTIDDNFEWNVLYSNPADQDTDHDSLADGYEYFLGTSVLLDDTDGDQISDGDEVFSRNRNPRVADLPSNAISVGDVRLQLDQRFTYVDETGHTASTTDSATSTLESNSSSTSSTGANLTFKGGVDVEGGFGDGSPAKITEGEVPTPMWRINPSFGVEYTSEWSSESLQETQRAYEQSLERASELSSTNTVTREVLGADISADVTIENQGNVAFTISSLQVTVSERDPRSTSRLLPVATLIANSTLTTGDDATFHLGPFNRTRGPIEFSSRDVFPNLVQQLMSNPGSLVFDVANFDMVDEFGRHFTYSNQIARDRTGGIVIDSGDGNIQSELVATSLQADPDHLGHRLNPDYAADPANEPMYLDYVGGFNDNGSPIGIPLDFALQHVLGMTKNATDPDGIVVGLGQTAHTRASGDDVQLVPVGTTGLPVGTIIVGAGANHVLDTVETAPDTAEVTTGYETKVIDGVESLIRVGSRKNGDFDSQWVITTTHDIRAGTDFGQLFLNSGEDFYFVFVQDLDQDGIFARTEFLAGSTDSRADIYDNSKFGHDLVLTSEGYVLPAPTLFPGGDHSADSKDTDRDGIGDYAELKVGWRVSADGGLLRQVFSSPRLPDSDGDGLLDPQEQDLRNFCDPSDYRIDALCAFQTAPAVDPNDAIAIIAGANGAADTLATGDDVQLVSQGITGLTFATQVVGPGANGSIDTIPSPLDELESAASSRRIPPATDPRLSDTDSDAVNDFDEVHGYLVGLSIRDGGPQCADCRGVADTLARQDDVQQARLNGPVMGGGIVILPGPNRRIDSILNEDAPNHHKANSDDVNHDGDTVVTDPLRRDTDSDLVPDGSERDMGGDPTDPLDAPLFKDSDQDGLTDSDESVLGWFVSKNGEASYLVWSNSSRPDTDGDGLPDLAERAIGIDPTLADTDGDGLSDFNEFADFELLLGLGDGFPGYFIDATASRQYGSDPRLKDSDADGLTDREELVTGYHILVGGESQARWIRTNPTAPDTDRDGATDYEEKTRTDGIFDASPQMTILTDPISFDSWGIEVYDNDDPTGTLMWSVPQQSIGVTATVDVTYGDNTLPGASSPTALQPGTQYYWRWQVHTSFGLSGWNTMSPLTTEPVKPACGQIAGALQPTDATDPDTDDDGRLDGVEINSSTCPLIKDMSVTVKFGTLTLDNFPTVSNDGAKISWFYTVTPPSGSDDTVLVSNACDTSQLCEAFLQPTPPSLACVRLPITDPIAHYTLNHTSTSKTWNANAPHDAGTPPTFYRGKYSMTLRPGQQFTVSGILFEYDDASDDCGVGPPDGNFIPSSVRSGCVTRFSQSFSFNDFDSAGKANFPFPTGQGTANNCDWTQEVFVTSQ